MREAQKLIGRMNPKEGWANSSSGRERKAFTLIEMLVVIGIIAILSAAAMVGYSKMVKSAKKARTQELVSNAATALTHILSKNNGVWPKYLLDRASGGNGVLDDKTSRIFVQYKLLGLSYRLKNKSEEPYPDNVELTGKDRCGIVDAEAEAVLKRSTKASESTKVSTGGTVKDHILYFAIDEDGDGITEAKPGGGSLRVRAAAVVWAAGEDGKVDYGYFGRNDDVYSWRPSQVKK